MLGNYSLPPTFTIEHKRIGSRSHILRTAQILPFSREEIFTFFEDPGNLFEITPDWLNFRMADREKSPVFEGAEFDYTIQWLWLTLRWRSRIVDYNPPERFTDVQIQGPYRYWRHLHTFEQIQEGTRMRDSVTYRLPLAAVPLHRFLIKRQLHHIFCYRAVRVAEWSRGNMKPKPHYS